MKSGGVALITGSAGLVGSEAARHFADRGWTILGVDNDMRRFFFGDQASTSRNLDRLQGELGNAYRHAHIDIRDGPAVESLVSEFGSSIRLIVHAAGQPSHDWAAVRPDIDFEVNARATLGLLEAARRHCPEAVFIFMSTNKVYGDHVNRLPLVQRPTRWEIDPDHPWAAGITEEMPVDRCVHSMFGVSKLAADLAVQEYGLNFGIPTVCFRAGCITGPAHAGAKAHGFLAYLLRCVAAGLPYEVYGYEAKQVRDSIHSCDLVAAFDCFMSDPRPGCVYNIGGGRTSNCSMLEAIEMAEQITEKRLRWSYEPRPRTGDHIWWISDTSKFESQHPRWKITRTIPGILAQIYSENRKSWTGA